MPMGSSHYVFSSVWQLPAPPDEAYDVLIDAAGYPTWWPQVRAVRQIDESTGEMVCRSLLPYELTFVVHAERQDRVAGVLRARVDGDLIGITQWTLRPAGTGGVACRAVFDEDVRVGSGLLRAAGVLARPALRFNHDLMMRAGERGLQRLLAGRRG
jgi:hypothetical protein